MPFDQETEDLNPIKSSGLKQVSSQKSIFDNIPKKPTQEDLDRRVQQIEEKKLGHNLEANDLSKQFIKILNDKTLRQNKSIFVAEAEKEILSKMINLAVEINTDPNEQEGMGSLSWVALLLKICIAQRDRANQFEYELQEIKKKLDTGNGQG